MPRVTTPGNGCMKRDHWGFILSIRQKSTYFKMHKIEYHI